MTQSGFGRGIPSSASRTACLSSVWHSRGAGQAERYVLDLFAAFGRIETHGVASRPIQAEFGVEGFYFRQGQHFVYWRKLSNGDVGIVTILHERMHQMDRFRDDRSV